MKKILSNQGLELGFLGRCREMEIFRNMREEIKKIIQNTNWQDNENWHLNEKNREVLQALIEWVVEVSYSSYQQAQNLPSGIKDNIKRVLEMIFFS